MNDSEIMSHITELIDTEHKLRGQLARGELSSEQEKERLRSAEEALDQFWDLLRQRRAKRQYGEDPESAAARPVPEVEGYQQLCPEGSRGYKEAVRCEEVLAPRGPGLGTPGASGKTTAKEHRAYREVRQG
jgi:hypothetical protein